MKRTDTEKLAEIQKIIAEGHHCMCSDRETCYWCHPFTPVNKLRTKVQDVLDDYVPPNCMLY